MVDAEIGTLGDNLLTMSYKNIEAWRLSREIVIEIHSMSLRLPKFEQFEEGQQIRRSAKSIKSNIVEGYGRRRYKQDFIRFLVIAIASVDETIDHLETLSETGSLSDRSLFNDINSKLILLSKKLINFLKAVEEKHNETA
jgi:four helix bundle protein